MSSRRNAEIDFRNRSDTAAERIEALMAVAAAAGETVQAAELEAITQITREQVALTRPPIGRNLDGTPDRDFVIERAPVPLDSLDQVARRAQQLEQLLAVVGGAASVEGAIEFPRAALETLAMFLNEMAGEICDACHLLNQQRGAAHA